MNKRRIGTSDLWVSEIGLGCMSIGTDEQKALTLIDKALDLGINYLDTADLYDQGLNEEFVGKAIKENRKNIILATKVGNRVVPGIEGWTWDPSKQYIKQAVKESLRRLQTDYIDLYQLHGGTIEDNIDETIEAFEELMKEGVIRNYGISSIRPNVIREYVKRSSIVSVMMQYSILDRRPEEEIFTLLKENKISILARGPVAKGLLTEKPLENANDRIKLNGYLDYSFDELQQVISNLKQHVAHERSLTELALKYVLHDDVVASVVAGASKIEQLSSNIRAISTPDLEEKVIQQIQDYTKASVYDQHR